MTLKNKFPKKSKTIEKSPKITKKAQSATHYVAVGLGSLSVTLWASSIALSLTGPGIIVGAPLDAVGAFSGAGSAALTSLSKKLGLKVTKHEKIYTLATAKHNSLSTPLFPKV